MEFAQLIADSGIDALRTVLGRDVFQLFTRAIEVRGHQITATDFSLSLGNKSFCVIENDWADTPKTALDYYFLKATICDWPKGVERSVGPTGTEALLQPSSITLRTPAAAVTSIVVLEHRESFEDESLRYDSVIVFSRADGYRFALFAERSIIGQLEFTDSEDAISRLMEDNSERLRLS
jgi:hypothetical protein